MEGKAHEAAIQIPAAELGTVEGVKRLIEELDKLFLKDSTQCLFQAMENFEQYTRSSEESIDDYIREFEQRYKRLKDLRSNTEAYEDGIKAFKLLHQANLKPDQKRLIRATTEKLTYDGMVKALKRTFGDGSGILKSSNGSNPYLAGASSSGVLVKQEPTFYTQGNVSSGDTDQSGYCSSAPSERSRMPSSSPSPSEDEENVFYLNGQMYRRENNRGQRPNFYQREKMEKNRHQRDYQRSQFQQRDQTSRNSPKKGSYKTDQKKTTCLICESPDHFVATCPYNALEQNKKEDKMGKRLTFLTKMDCNRSEVSLPARDDRYSCFIYETVNKALLDTGASSTVCGQNWLKVYEDSLSLEETELITTESCETAFRFGDGDMIATELVTIPVKMFGKRIFLKTHVIDSEIPLLLSRHTMNELGFVIDMKQKRVFALGGVEPILDTQSGHLVVSIIGIQRAHTKAKTRVSDAYLEKPC